MKFLPPDRYYNDVIPISITYDRGEQFRDDVLTIVYKDLSTSQKQILTIYNPIIEAYIVKEEFRDYTHIRDWFPKEKTVPVLVHYKTRFSELSKKMGLPNSEAAKISPYIFGADIDIINYYFMQFAIEYPVKSEIKLSLGYLDIENDVILHPSIQPPGTTPVNAVTYIDGETLQAFQFILVKDCLPVVDMSSPYYIEIEELRNGLYDQAKKMMADPNGYIEELHQTFDDFYGELEYNVFYFDDEIKLLNALWKIIRSCDNDYIQVWNMPYDLQNLMKRPSQLGVDPNVMIIDPRFLKESNCHMTMSYEWSIENPKRHVPIRERHISFFEDMAPQIHRRRHVCTTYTFPLFVDQMVHYAGIRSGGGKIPSFKLGIIAKRELGDTKLNYSEDGDIRHLYYRNFRKFSLYNLKDVLLLLGINRVTGDMDVIYNRMYVNTLPNYQAFTTTKVVLGSLTEFGYERNYVFGANKNKFGDPASRGKIIDYGAIIRETPYDEDLFIGEDEDEEDDGEEEIIADDGKSKKKRDKYQGAFVMNPLHMKSTGYYIMGRPSKYVHEWTADYDVTSEYPTAVCICNISNETLVGKVFLDDPSSVTVPLYQEMKFRGDEAVKYKFDISNFMLEVYSERDVLNFGNLFLDLPTMSEIFEEIDANLDDLIKGESSHG